MSRLIMVGVLLTAGIPMLNTKAKDQLEFKKVMIAFYDFEDYLPAFGYLLDYYIEHNQHIKD